MEIAVIFGLVGTLLFYYLGSKEKERADEIRQSWMDSMERERDLQAICKRYHEIVAELEEELASYKES